MILVTGASGNMGRAVLAEVAGGVLPHRALYRSAAEAARAPARTNSIIADFADRPSLDAALDGIETVYLVCAPIPELVELETNVVAASRAAGVRRIVLNSALGAEDYPKSFPSWHRAVEDRLKASGLAWCILRPNSFMQNILLYFAPSIRAQGVFYGAMGDARTSFVDVRDVAAVAAAALRDSAHDGQTYELNGPEALTYAEVAAKISQHAGIAANYVDIPEAAQRQAMLDQNMPHWQVDALLDLQRYYTGGRGGVTDDVLPRLLGRPANTMDQFLRDFAADIRG
jgi:uncharacterized protein YbjT (DUF2867 family)